MTRLILMIVAFVLPPTAVGQMLGDISQNKRVLLICATQPAVPGSGPEAIQVSSLDDVGMAERDLVIVYVDASTLDTTAHDRGGDTFSAACNRTPGAFSVHLLGKDGGIKQSSRDPIPAETLYAAIDAMPMRQMEMRDQADR